MPTYLMLTTLTPQGVQTLKANPSRLREVFERRGLSLAGDTPTTPVRVDSG